MNKEPEIWVDIVGYEGRYSISNFGRIASYRGGKWRILHPTVNKSNGYVYVVLCQNGIKKSFRVHKLVANHFMQKSQEHTEVNHKDEDKTNNRVDNLEWCTKSYNINYGTRNERQRVHLCKAVAQYDMTGKLVAVYDSLAQAEKITGFGKQHMCQCCRNQRPRAYGFLWRYLEEVHGVTEQ